MQGIQIMGTGCYLPERVVENEEFTKFVDTSDEWIRTRTGISRRRMVNGEPTWYMAAQAAKQALQRAGITPQQVGLIITTSVTPDFFTPSMSCFVQRELGAIGSMTIDINCACAGCVYGIDMARRYLMTSTEEEIQYALVVSSEQLSRNTDFEDRSTCVLFGDGAAAVVLQRGEGMYASFLGGDGNGAKYLYARALPSRNPFMKEPYVQVDDQCTGGRDHYFYMNGKEVYKFAVNALPRSARKAAEKAGISIDEIDWFIPHQANIRIIQTAAERLGVSMDKFIVNIAEYSNTSSATVTLALNEGVADGRIQRGQKICLVGFGAGLVYGAIVMEF